MRIKKLKKPVRSSAYLRWIRSLPCLIEGCPRRYVEACHTGGHGLGQKASDLQTIPLCRVHHLEYHAGTRAFLGKYNLHLPEILARLTTKPRVRIHFGLRVAYFGEPPVKEYILGPVEDDMEAALRKVQTLWWEDRRVS